MANLSHLPDPQFICPDPLPIDDPTRVPFGTERDCALETIDDLESRISDLRDIQAAVRNYLQLLETREADTRDNIIKYLVYVAPIRRLPNELLLNIFERVIWTQVHWDGIIEEDRYRTTSFVSHIENIGQLILSHVCARWRTIAISQRSWWTIFPIFGHCRQTSREMAAIWFHRTLYRQAPCIRRPITIIVPQRLYTVHPELIKPTVESIIRQFSRAVGALIVNGQYIGAGLTAHGCVYPHLKHIVVYNRELHDRIDLGQSVQTLSVLRATDPLLLGATSANLQRLKIDVPFSLHDLKKLLPLYDNLQELSMKFDSGFASFDSTEMEITNTIHLAHLASLTITAEGGNMNFRRFFSFLERVRFPLLRTLHVAGHGWSTRDMNAIADSLHYSQPPLESFRQERWIEPPTLRRILRACTRLDTLCILSDTDICNIPPDAWPPHVTMHLNLSLSRGPPYATSWREFMIKLNALHLPKVRLTVSGSPSNRRFWEQGQRQERPFDPERVTIYWDIMDDDYRNTAYWVTTF